MFGNFEDDDDDDNEYDDFFFESVRRYDTLQMFNLENTPYHVLQTDETSICVASNLSNGKKSELLQLQLPEKLILGPEEEGRSKGNDFKVICGVYTENIVWEIDRLENSNKILVSQENSEGLRIYNLQQQNPGNFNSRFTNNFVGKHENKHENKYVKCHGSNCKCERLKAITWVKPNVIALKKTNNIICSKCNHEPVIAVNAEVDQITKTISHPFYIIDFQSLKTKDPCTSNSIKCQALSNNSVAILNTYSGNLVLHDLRTYDCFVPLPGLQSDHNVELWSISGNSFQDGFCNYIGTISNRQSFCVYDMRVNSMVFKNVGSDVPQENHGNLRLLFNCAKDRFSISGTHSFVQVFSFDQFSYKQIFIHNGHCPTNVSSNFVTDHIWLNSGSKEYIISICDNKTLNCWQFNPDF